MGARTDCRDLQSERGTCVSSIQYLVAHQQAAARLVHEQTCDVAKLDRFGAATVAAEFEHEGAGWPGGGTDGTKNGGVCARV